MVEYLITWLFANPSKLVAGASPPLPPLLVPVFVIVIVPFRSSYTISIPVPSLRTAFTLSSTLSFVKYKLVPSGSSPVFVATVGLFVKSV